ncbi:MAG: hypothetical protein KAJ91_04015 [Candidatus Aenigmarchaeota archaeon]|nr:hypothetical protein [Candidatus Aenigmarchaeota archaeon]
MPKDWRDSLDTESAHDLNDLIVSALKHRQAYDKSGDPRVAQLWLAFVELYKRNAALEKRLEACEERLFGKKERSSILNDLENY